MSPKKHLEYIRIILIIASVEDLLFKPLYITALFFMLEFQ